MLLGVLDVPEHLVPLRFRDQGTKRGRLVRGLVVRASALRSEVGSAGKVWACSPCRWPTLYHVQRAPRRPCRRSRSARGLSKRRDSVNTRFWSPAKGNSRREPAQQSWPELNQIPSASQLAVSSTSAELNTSAGDYRARPRRISRCPRVRREGGGGDITLPPSSSVTFLRLLSAAATEIRRPVTTLPVNAT